jgi:hypothetical protein
MDKSTSDLAPERHPVRPTRPIRPAKPSRRSRVDPSVPRTPVSVTAVAIVLLILGGAIEGYAVALAAGTADTPGQSQSLIWALVGVVDHPDRLGDPARPVVGRSTAVAVSLVGVALGGYGGMALATGQHGGQTRLTLIGLLAIGAASIAILGLIASAWPGSRCPYEARNGLRPTLLGRRLERCRRLRASSAGVRGILHHDRGLTPRYAARAAATAESPSATIRAARSAAFSALPIATVATGTPRGIWTIERASRARRAGRADRHADDRERRLGRDHARQMRRRRHPRRSPEPRGRPPLPHSGT